MEEGQSDTAADEHE